MRTKDATHPQEGPRAVSEVVKLLILTSFKIKLYQKRRPGCIHLVGSHSEFRELKLSQPA